MAAHAEGWCGSQPRGAEGQEAQEDTRHPLGTHGAAPIRCQAKCRGRVPSPAALRWGRNRPERTLHTPQVRTKAHN